MHISICLLVKMQFWVILSVLQFAIYSVDDKSMQLSDISNALQYEVYTYVSFCHIHVYFWIRYSGQWEYCKYGF